MPNEMQDIQVDAELQTDLIRLYCYHILKESTIMKREGALPKIRLMYAMRYMEHYHNKLFPNQAIDLNWIVDKGYKSGDVIRSQMVQDTVLKTHGFSVEFYGGDSNKLEIGDLFAYYSFHKNIEVSENILCEMRKELIEPFTLLIKKINTLSAYDFRNFVNSKLTEDGVTIEDSLLLGEKFQLPLFYPS